MFIDFVKERMPAILKTKKYTLPAMIVAFAIIAFATVAYAVSASVPADPTETDANSDIGEVGAQVYSDHTLGDADSNNVVGVENNTNLDISAYVEEEQGVNIVGMEYETTIDLSDDMARGELGPLVSVSHDDEWKFTPEEWAEILEKIELGEIYWED